MTEPNRIPGMTGGDEPLLPVEKRLIGWSLFAGLVLLGALVWLSYTFFPAS